MCLALALAVSALGDESSLIDLGTFADCIHGHDLKSVLEFSLKWRLTTPLGVRNSLDRRESYVGTSLGLTSRIKFGRGEQPEVENIRYELSNERPISDREISAPPLVVGHVKWIPESRQKCPKFKQRIRLQ